jgi:hypothetical protein
MRLTSVLLAVCCWLSAAYAQPFPSYPVDTARIIGSAGLTLCLTPEGAFHDSIGLVAWTDRDQHASAARITPSFELVDTIPIDVSGDDVMCVSFSEELVQVAASASGFLCVWESEVRLMLTLVGRDGSVRARLDLASDVQYRGFDVASDGEGYFVVWTMCGGEIHRVKYAELGADGGVLKSGTLATESIPMSLEDPSVAWGESSYVIGYVRRSVSGPGEIVGHFYRPGIGPDTTTFVIPDLTIQPKPGLSFDGQNVIVGWADDSGAVRVCRVTSHGAIIDTGGVLVAENAYDYDLVSLRETTLVLWSEELGNDSGVYRVRRLDAQMRILDTVAITVESASQMDEHPSVDRWDGGFACFGTRELDPLWEGTSDRDVFGSRVTTGGIVLDPAGPCFSMQADNQSYPDVASDGDRFLIVWTNHYADSAFHSRIRGRLYDREGSPLDSAFSVSPPFSCPGRPQVAYGDGYYLVCWSTEREDDLDATRGSVYAARVSAAGVVLDTAPVLVDSLTNEVSGRDPDVAFGGGLFLVVWERYKAYGRRFVATHESLIPRDSIPFNTSLDGMGRREPKVVSDGTNFIVASASAGYNALYVSKVLSIGGVVRDVFLEGPINHDRKLAVAYGDNGFLVLDAGIEHAWRLDTSLTVRSFLRLVENIIPSAGWECGTAFDGTQFVVAYVPQGGMTHVVPVFTVPFPEPGNDTLATLDTGFFRGRCALAADTLGRLLAVYSTFEPTRCMSGRVRVVGFPAPGIAESDQGAPLSLMALSCRPTVVIDRVRVELSAARLGTTVLSLYDVAGRVCWRTVVAPGRAEPLMMDVDLGGIPAGVYVMQLEPGRSRVRIIVNR